MSALAFAPTLAPVKSVASRRIRSKASLAVAPEASAGPGASTHVMLRFDASGCIHWMNSVARAVLGEARKGLAGALTSAPSPPVLASFPVGNFWLGIGAAAHGSGVRLDEEVSRINRALSEICRRRGRRNLELLRLEEVFQTRSSHAMRRRMVLKTGSEFIAALETERGRIARELHDNAGQSLAGILLNLELVERYLGSANAQALARLARSKELASLTLAQIRRISHEMHPPQWDEQDFPSAVERLVDTMGLRGRLAVELDNLEAPPDLPAAVKTTLYRSLQEGLTNVLRHSRASRVKIQMAVTAAGVRLVVEDDGRGFDPTASPRDPTGIGLSSIRRRVESLGGSLEISSSPGRGVTLSVFAPTAPDGP